MEKGLHRFTGMTVIVTGAGSGIGKATAERFHEEGANVVALVHNRAKGEKALAGLTGDSFLLVDGDVADPAVAENVAKAALDRFGRIDVLVNNAGIANVGSVAELSLEDWKRQLDVNVTGYFLMAKAMLPEIRKNKGAIVMTSSVSGIGGDWGMAGYNAAKGAVTNLVRAMALDHAGEGIRVNAVCPSFTRTGLNEDMQGDEELMAQFMARIPAGRAGEPEDVAAVIAFLASKDAIFVNGVNLPVDGGLSASNGQPALG